MRLRADVSGEGAVMRPSRACARIDEATAAAKQAFTDAIAERDIQAHRRSSPADGRMPALRLLVDAPRKRLTALAAASDGATS